MTTKKIFMAIALAIAFHTSNAQRLDLFGGLNSSGIKHTIGGTRQDGTGRIKFHVGLGVFVPFSIKDYKEGSGSAGIYPSLQYVKKGVSKSSIIGGSPADINLSYLQFNLPLHYIGGAYGIGIGPYAGYCMSGSKKFRAGTTTNGKVDFANELKRLDYGASINFQLGIFKLQYDLGLANLTKISGQSAKSRNFSLSIQIPIVE